MVLNLKIGFLLHFYQPWWQYPEVLSKIVNECYLPILELVKKTSGFCFSANINFSLLDLLQNSHAEDVIYGFKKAAEEKKIELLGSAAYHPIMPLIPKEVRIAQMVRDTELKKSCCGIERNCNGIFLPEMAYSQTIFPTLQEYGYFWTILDDEVFRVQYGYAPFDHVVSLQGFKVFLRSNYWSNRISGGQFSFSEIRDKMNREIPDWTKNQPAYLILAMDGETFGHHHKMLIEKFLEPMLKEWGNAGENILTPLEKIGEIFPPKPLVKLYEDSWATTEDDYRKDDSYPLWKSKFNPYHKEFWQLVNIALAYFYQEKARHDCLQMTSSCHWWWISRRPYWEPKFMMFGAKKAMKVIYNFATDEEIKAAEKIFERLCALRK